METRTQILKQKNNGGTGLREASSRLTLIVLLATSLLFASQVSAAVAIVVSADSSLSSMTKDQVGTVFLGKMKDLPNGVKAKPVNQPEESAIFDAFNEKVVGRPSDKVLQYWLRITFSGKGNPPQTLDNDAAVKAYVSSTAGGIGYIDSASADDSVKVIYQTK